LIQKVKKRILFLRKYQFVCFLFLKGANNQLKENADKFYSKDEDLLLGMEDMASSVTEDDNSQMQSQSSLQDIQPMDSSEEIL